MVLETNKSWDFTCGYLVPVPWRLIHGVRTRDMCEFQVLARKLWERNYSSVLQAGLYPTNFTVQAQCSGNVVLKPRVRDSVLILPLTPTLAFYMWDWIGCKKRNDWMWYQALHWTTNKDKLKTKINKNSLSVKPSICC